MCAAGISRRDNDAICFFVSETPVLRTGVFLRRIYSWYVAIINMTINGYDYRSHQGGKRNDTYKGSKTYENLLIAFAGESQARNGYLFCVQGQGRRVYADCQHI